MRRNVHLGYIWSSSCRLCPFVLVWVLRNFTDCFDKSLGQSCTLGCEAGYTPVGEPAVQCRLNGTFSEPTLLCVPASCGDLSADPDFPPNIVGHTCTGAVFGESCIANCQDGYRLLGARQAPSGAIKVSAFSKLCCLCFRMLPHRLRLVGSEVQLACRAVSVSAGFTLSNGEPAQPPTCQLQLEGELVCKSSSDVPQRCSGALRSCHSFFQIFEHLSTLLCFCTTPGALPTLATAAASPRREECSWAFVGL